MSRLTPSASRHNIKIMQQPVPVEIPDKLFFKIGEVCELVGVQAHVLRYWETEFSMLQPQKNRSGQRTYRRRDVEMALRIRQLLYDEGFTIAGAKKRLTTESRTSSSKLKIVPAGATADDFQPVEPPPPPVSRPEVTTSPSRLSRETIRRLRQMAEELLTLIDGDVNK
jgi:DNA-binding transcriptional MerR regulator